MAQLGSCFKFFDSSKIFVLSHLEDYIRPSSDFVLSCLHKTSSVQPVSPPPVGFPRSGPNVSLDQKVCDLVRDVFLCCLPFFKPKPLNGSNSFGFSTPDTLVTFNTPGNGFSSSYSSAASPVSGSVNSGATRYSFSPSYGSFSPSYGSFQNLFQN